MASKYEREIRYLLSGREEDVKEMVARVERTDPAGARKYRRILDHPFFVLRSAGSLGVDIVALRGEISFPIEVKTANSDRVRMSKSQHIREQAEAYERTCARSGLIPIYAFRRRDMQEHDPWRVYTLKSQALDGDADLAPRRGRAGRIYEWIPTADVTDEGNYILYWDKGQPLHELIYRLSETLFSRETTAGRPRA